MKRQHVTFGLSEAYSMDAITKWLAKHKEASITDLARDVFDGDYVRANNGVRACKLAGLIESEGKGKPYRLVTIK